MINYCDSVLDLLAQGLRVTFDISYRCMNIQMYSKSKLFLSNSSNDR